MWPRGSRRLFSGGSEFIIKIRRKRRRKGRFSEILSRFRRLIVSSLHSARLARAARTRAVCGAHVARARNRARLCAPRELSVPAAAARTRFPAHDQYIYTKICQKHYTKWQNFLGGLPPPEPPRAGGAGLPWSPTGRFALPRMHAKGQNFFSIILIVF